MSRLILYTNSRKCLKRVHTSDANASADADARAIKTSVNVTCADEDAGENPKPSSPA